MALAEPVLAIKPFQWRLHGSQVLEFQYEVYQCNFPGFVGGDGFLADYERQLRQAARNPYEGLWVVEEGRRVVGFAWASVISTLVDERLGYLKNVYVRPECRGQGWGEKLVAHAEAWMRVLGVEKSSLDVTVTNDAAVSLYQRCGYHAQRYRMEKDLTGKEAERP